jgi:DNA-binding CsgD family transcriptional regulator/tetratricopeptide (TPR) repeat protein
VSTNAKPVERSIVAAMRSEALALHRRGRFAEAISILDRSTVSDDATSLLLRARLSIALSPSAAIATLHDPRFADYSQRDQAEAAMLRGRAHAKLGEYNTAEQCFATAHSLMKEGGVADHDLLRELDLSIGATMIALSRVDEADDIAKALLESEKSSPTAATLRLLAQVAWRREELDKTAGYLLQALGSISADVNPDVRLWAETVQGLAHVLQFVESPAVRQAVAHHVTALPWTDELADSHSEVYQLLGTRASLDGAFTEGLALYRRAATTPAASLTVRITAILYRADLSRWLGELFSFEDYLLEATALAQQVNWRNAAPASRQPLLLLALLHARRDGALALSFAAHFEAIGGFGVHNPGVSGVAMAQRNYCLGVLCAETGEKNRGVGMLEAAFSEFVRLRYDWPAAETAIALAETTNSAVWRSRARGLLARYPNSYLNKRLGLLDRLGGGATRNVASPLIEDAKVTSLTPAQRTIYHRLLENVSVKEIAADLNRSDLTIRNHIQAIFRKFGVTSRADLVNGRRETADPSGGATLR